MSAAPSTGPTPPPGADEAYARFPKDRRTTTSDGTVLAWTVLEPPADRPRRRAVLTANGWSCSDAHWAHLAPALARSGHPVVVVDPRGHGASGLPRHPGRGAAGLRPEDLAIERFARDLIEVADDADLDEVVVVGHSMGVQVALETSRLAPERVAGLALIAGSHENPLRTFWGVPLADLAFPVTRTAVTTLPEVARLASQAVRLTPVATAAARLVGGTGPKAEPEDLVPYFRHIAAADPAVMIRTADAMRRHSAGAHLAEVTAPTLVLAAGRDGFTPPRCSRVLFERIPTAEIQWFAGAGHSLPIEEPEAIAAHLDEWYTRRVDRG